MSNKRYAFDLQMFATPVQPTTGNTFNYTDSDRENLANFGKLLQPRFRKIFFESYTELPEQYSKVYNILKSGKADEKDWGMGAFGDWTERASQFDEVDYKKLSPGLERTYVHSAFTQGFMITREMYDDEQYRQMDKMPKAMARSGRAKLERDAASLLVNGFSANVGGVGASAIYDGKALFAANHGLLDSSAVCSNLATGPLNQTNLTNAINIMRSTLDEAGNIAVFKPTKLLIPPALHDTAVRVLQSNQIAGTDLNDTNKFLNGYGIEIVVLDWLGAAAGGSDTHWFLQDGTRHELNFFWRIRPEFKWEEDFDTFISKYRGYMRYSFGVSDWRGIVGSDGLPVTP
jgi:phage major head subunit gpT-like protein